MILSSRGDPICFSILLEIIPPIASFRSQLLRTSVPPTCSEERRQLEPNLAFWSEFASACVAQVHSLCASVTAVYLPFLVFGRVLNRLD